MSELEWKGKSYVQHWPFPREPIVDSKKGSKEKRHELISMVGELPNKCWQKKWHVGLFLIWPERVMMIFVDRVYLCFDPLVQREFQSNLFHRLSCHTLLQWAEAPQLFYSSNFKPRQHINWRYSFLIPPLSFPLLLYSSPHLFTYYPSLLPLWLSLYL